jgi:hypothetical protein
MARGSAIDYTPVGTSLNNGFDLGGARIYPFSTGLAINPPAYYSNYVGTGNGLPVTPPVAALSGTSGVTSNGDSLLSGAKASPLSLSKSPLPWVIIGLFGAVAAMHVVHYKVK